MEKINKLLFGFFILSVLWVYKSWFLPGVITGGDLWYFFPSMFNNHTLIPNALFFGANNGFGGSSILYSAVNFIMAIPLSFGKIFNLPWEFLERVFILFPFLIISTVSIIALIRKIFPDNKIYFIAPLVFVLNSYILMLVSGGLVLIGIAYGLIPLIILILLLIQEKARKLLFLSLSLGFILSLQTLLDMRVTYMTGWIMVIIYLLNTITTKKLFDYKLIIYGFIFPIFVDIFLNIFWIFPSLFTGVSAFNSLGDAYTSLESVKFFSFATFENSFSLLHPNWPENIFGKIYFQRPEFLLLPLLAFSSLLLTKEKKEKFYVILFSIVALLGIFLGKGANEIFGAAYLFMFSHVPGFILFRDSTKWYMLTAVAFSVLIPYALYKLSTIKKIFQVLPVIFMIYFIYLMLPGYLGKLPGTLQKSVVPAEYTQFDKFMSNQNNFSRTLWIPHPSRFSYQSPMHPAVAADQYFKISTASAIVGKLNTTELKDLANNSVQYIIIPIDNRGEIFIKDRKYDHNEYLKTSNLISKIPDLKVVRSFGGLKIYEINHYSNNVVTQAIDSDTNTQFLIGSIVSLASLIIFIFIYLYLFYYESKV